VNTPNPDERPAQAPTPAPSGDSRSVGPDDVGHSTAQRHSSRQTIREYPRDHPPEVPQLTIRYPSPAPDGKHETHGNPATRHTVQLVPPHGGTDALCADSWQNGTATPR